MTDSQSPSRKQAPGEMVERVARAIRASFFKTPWRYARDPWQKVARAAIEAMREPTGAMDEAGRYRCHGIDLRDGTSRTVCGGFLSETAAEQWRRMIDAALTGGACSGAMGHWGRE